MRKLLDILYRLARLLSGVRPDAAAMMLCALRPPGILLGFLLWVIEGVAFDLVKLLVLYPATLFVWRRLTPEERRRLVGLRDRFLPPGGARGGGEA